MNKNAFFAGFAGYNIAWTFHAVNEQMHVGNVGWALANLALFVFSLVFLVLLITGDLNYDYERGVKNGS